MRVYPTIRTGRFRHGYARSEESPSHHVLKGTAEVTHRHKDLPKEQDVVSTLIEGDSVLIPANVYYQLHNPGPDQLILYQVKQPGDLVSVEGKGILKPGSYYTKAREEQGDLSDWKEEVEPVKPGDNKTS
jgi:oxalate decarboxylase/phosphoglucose isomerase-like protein (cupin superfamily)